MSKKRKSPCPQAAAPVAAPEIWVIDTGTPGESADEFSARGPYPSVEAAEAAIAEDVKVLWENSCACLTAGHQDKPWCSPLLIAQVLRRVEPQITASVQLVDV